MENKVNALADYLNESIEDIYFSKGYFHVNQSDYEVVSELEYDKTLDSCLDPLQDEIEYELKHKNLEYLIPYINWEDYFEDTSLTDFEYDEYYYDGDFYYIRKL